jgi:hypothetical protein
MRSQLSKSAKSRKGEFHFGIIFVVVASVMTIQSALSAEPLSQAAPKTSLS